LRFSFEKKFTEIADATEMYLKQSYHSITFPAVAAIITFPAIPRRVPQRQHGHFAAR
jgi:hypothetical protein